MVVHGVNSKNLTVTVLLVRRLELAKVLRHLVVYYILIDVVGVVVVASIKIELDKVNYYVEKVEFVVGLKKGLLLFVFYIEKG